MTASAAPSCWRAGRAGRAGAVGVPVRGCRWSRCAAAEFSAALAPPVVHAESAVSAASRPGRGHEAGPARVPERTRLIVGASNCTTTPTRTPAASSARAARTPPRYVQVSPTEAARRARNTSRSSYNNDAAPSRNVADPPHVPDPRAQCALSHRHCDGGVRSAITGMRDTGWVPSLRLALAQVNYTVGDLAANAAMVLSRTQGGRRGRRRSGRVPRDDAHRLPARGPRPARRAFRAASRAGAARSSPATSPRPGSARSR